VNVSSSPVSSFFVVISVVNAILNLPILANRACFQLS